MYIVQTRGKAIIEMALRLIKKIEGDLTINLPDKSCKSQSHCAQCLMGVHVSLHMHK